MCVGVSFFVQLKVLQKVSAEGARFGRDDTIIIEVSKSQTFRQRKTYKKE